MYKGKEGERWFSELIEACGSFCLFTKKSLNFIETIIKSFISYHNRVYFKEVSSYWIVDYSINEKQSQGLICVRNHSHCLLEVTGMSGGGKEEKLKRFYWAALLCQ